MKVDDKRISGMLSEETMRQAFYENIHRDSTITKIHSIIFYAVREQTEWLMEEVCSDCGKPVCDCPSYPMITRAEYLRQRGEKP